MAALTSSKSASSPDITMRVAPSSQGILDDLKQVTFGHPEVSQFVGLQLLQQPERRRVATRVARWRAPWDDDMEHEASYGAGTSTAKSDTPSSVSRSFSGLHPSRRAKLSSTPTLDVCDFKSSKKLGGCVGCRFKRRDVNALDVEPDEPTVLEERKPRVDTLGHLTNSNGERFSEKPFEFREKPWVDPKLARESIREQLIEKAGSAKRAFKKLDINSSGAISVTDFAGGVKRLGIPWPQLIKSNNPGLLFKLFDVNKSGTITWNELFPGVDPYATSDRPSTPEFLEKWFRKNPESAFSEHHSSKWTPPTPGDHLKVLFANRDRLDQVEERRQWISTTFKRMKIKGKTDARAREMVALHLPRSTGPEDREGVATFSKADLKACKKKYQERASEPIKTIQRDLHAMKESRRLLQNYRANFDKVAMEPLRQLEREQKAKDMLGNKFAGMGFGKMDLGGGDSPPASPGLRASGVLRQAIEVVEKQGKTVGIGSRTFESMAEELQMDVSALHHLFKPFSDAYDRKSELVNRKGFNKIVSDISQPRTVADDDLDEWWYCARVRPYELDTAAGQEVKKRENYINFEQFMLWFGRSELRTQPFATG